MFVIMEWSPLFFSIVFWFYISKLWDFKHRKKGTAVSCALAQLFIFIIDIYEQFSSFDSAKTRKGALFSMIVPLCPNFLAGTLV
jgi:hypothetical protein